jgi:hypothetical protein
MEKENGLLSNTWERGDVERFFWLERLNRMALNYKA